MPYSAEHFQRLADLGGTWRDLNDPGHVAGYDLLKSDYDLTLEWATRLQERLFPDGWKDVRRRPINQGQKFLKYTWGKVYPAKTSPKELAYTVGTDATHGFVVKIDVTSEGDLRQRFLSEFQRVFSNESPIVAMMPAEVGCAMSMDQLVDWSIDKIRSFGQSYDEIAKGLGLSLTGNAPLNASDTGAPGFRMNALDATLLKKSGYENGWEYLIDSTSDHLVLGSASHAQELEILGSTKGWILKFHDATMRQELTRRLGVEVTEYFVVERSEEIDGILRMAAGIAMALPPYALQEFVKTLEQQGIGDGPEKTEVERLVRQRVGQVQYRKCLMLYWGDRCAVTGIAVPEVLRASHAKPWADCASDAERLNVFNGLLLVANLDALFDRGLISFDTSGNCLVSRKLPEDAAAELRVNRGSRLRWIAFEHQRYLEWHRTHVFQP